MIRRRNLRHQTLISLFLAAVLMMTLSVSAYAAKKENTLAAVSVVVLETAGEVEITNQSGNPIPVFEYMQLHSGYEVETEIRSYAWMALDDVKEAGLDSVSNMAVQKQGKQLVLMLDQGNMFFDVSKKLDSDETMNIRTSTMVMGIKGTFGVVQILNNMKTQIMCLDGITELNGVNPVSGASLQATLHAGELAIVLLTADGQVVISIVPLNAEDIPGFVLEYLRGNAETRERVETSWGEDLSEVIEHSAERLETDEQKKEERIAIASTQHQQEIQEAEATGKTVVPYFRTGNLLPRLLMRIHGPILLQVQ